MAGEVKRSGFSLPANANLTAALAPPSAPSGFEIYSWGLAATGAPAEVAKIVFRWLAPATRALTLADAAGDDVYDAGVSFGTIVGTHGVNDTVLTMTDSASTAGVVPGSRIHIGSDPTRYIVDTISSNTLTILYGLLSPIASSATDVKLLTKTGESPSTSRTLRVNARTGDTVSVTASLSSGSVGLGWSATSALGEWEDLDHYLITLDDAHRTHSVVTAGATVSLPCIAGDRIVPVSADLTGVVTPGVTSIAFGSFPTVGYLVDSVSTMSVYLTSAAGLVNAATTGDTVWIQDAGAYTHYDTLAVGDCTATEALGTATIAGYKLFCSSAAIATVSSAGVWNPDTFATNDARLVRAADGYNYLTWSAPSHLYDGMTLFWALCAYDSNTPPNVSAPDKSAWLTTYPGQAVITSASITGSTMTLTYENLTTGTASNRHLYSVMGSASMTEFSIDGGYDLYLVDYTALSGGSYQAVDTASATYLHPSLDIGDAVVIFDSGTSDEWTAICEAAGRATLTDARLTHSLSGSAQPYAGASCRHKTAGLTAKYARVTDRVGQSVLPPAGGGARQYLTDFQDTYAVTLAADKDQAVLMETVDTQVDHGKV